MEDIPTHGALDRTAELLAVLLSGSEDRNPCVIKVKGATSFTGTTRCNAFELLDIVGNKVSKLL